jgi:hypothetical protein
MAKYRKKTIEYINDQLDMDVRDLKIRITNDYLKTLKSDLTSTQRIIKLGKEFNLGVKAIERILATKDD